MTKLDVYVLTGFTLVVFLVGMLFGKMSKKNTGSFFAGGGTVPWWISGLSMFMSFLSAATFVVWGSIAYAQGFVAVVLQMTMCAGGLVVALWLAPRWKKKGYVTVGSFLHERVGASTQKFYTYLYLLFGLVTTGGVLYAVGKFLMGATGWDLSWCIIILGLSVVIYTAVGGYWAVLVTDVLQFVILSATVVIIIPYTLQEAGGWANFINQTPTGFFNLFSSEFTPWFMLAFWIYHVVYIGGNWAFVQRYSSVASPKAASKTVWLFTVLYLVSPIIWMLPPMLYRVIAPDISLIDKEGVYLLVCQLVLPSGLFGLMIAAMISATVSTANTNLNLCAAVFTMDIYKKIFPGGTEHRLVLVGRLSTLVFGVVTIAVGILIPYLGGIVNFILSMAALSSGALLLPGIWLLFSEKMQGKGLVWASLAGLLNAVFIQVIYPEWAGMKASRTLEFFTGILIPLAVLIYFEAFVYRHTAKITVSKPDLPNPQPDADDTGAKQFAVRIILGGTFVGGVIIGMLGIYNWHTGSAPSIVGLGLVAIAAFGWINNNIGKTKNAH